MTEAQVKKLINEALADALKPCRDVQRVRDEARVRELVRWRADVLNSAPDARMRAVREMTHAERVKLLDGINTDTAIDLVSGLDRDDQRILLDAMPAPVRVRCEPYARDLVRYHRLATAFPQTGHTGTTAEGGRIALTAEQQNQFADLGLWRYCTVGVSGYRQYAGLYLAEGVWILSRPQLDALLAIDGDLGEMIKAGTIKMTELPERECRDWMARA